MKVRSCVKCLLDSNDDANIEFNSEGVCKYCLRFEKEAARRNKSGIYNSNHLDNKVLEIKKNTKNSKYQCLIGLSGGVDSSYVAYWAYQNNLKPLVVHLDNGWNSELAVKNIEEICKRFNWDLHTHVIDWEEFRDLQLAYIRSSVVDIELLTDHAISAIIYKLASKYKIKYLLSGFNFVTEGIMIKGWTYNKSDYRNIQSITASKGIKLNQLKTYPTLPPLKKLIYTYITKIERINVLDYLNFNKFEAKELLKKELGWVDYGGKHYESVFTKFYQACILPDKFKIDKRKVHLSNLICSGQITRENAIKEISLPLLLDEERKELEEYVLKKLGIPKDEWGVIMRTPRVMHESFDSDDSFWKIYFSMIKFLKPGKWLVSKGK